MRRLSGVLLAGAILLLPAFSQEAFAQQAPQKTTYTGAAVLAAYAVNADKVADYEKVIETLKDALSKSSRPEAKGQLAGWKVIKNAAGDIVELRCTYDPQTRGGNAPDGRKVKATMHWLPAAQSVRAEIRIYNQLFLNPAPEAATFAADLNPMSLEVLAGAKVEPALSDAEIGKPVAPQTASVSPA